MRTSLRVSPMKSLNPSHVLASLKSGDIIGFSGHNIHSYIINLATYGWPGWGISHVGIIADYEGQKLIFESTTSAPDKCVIQNAYVTGTQAQRIVSRISHYNGKVWHYPLAKPLRMHESYRLTSFLMRNIGKPYDTAGSMLAGARLWSDIQAFFHEESLAALFCSEWVAAAHRHIERFDTPHVGKWSPNRLLREERRRGILNPPVRVK
jgi:hypothetical protein